MKFLRDILRDGYIASVSDGFYSVAPVGGESTEWQLTWFPQFGNRELLGTHYDKNEAMKRAKEHFGVS